MDMSLSSVENSMDCSDNSSECKLLTSNNNEEYPILSVTDSINDVFDEKSNKHSSRKQSKRRRKNSNHKRHLPRIIVKPLPPPPAESREWAATITYSNSSTTAPRPSTMREVLASIPGFCMKPRKRSSKKLSTAAQLQQTKEGCIDLETPDSILVNTNIRALLNKHTFSLLPPLYQYKLGQLLPSVDRPSTSGRLSSSSLNNEFFARACLEWQDSLSSGEFTPENQQKMKTEAEKEKGKIDPWKLKHFEPIWGEKLRKDRSSINLASERPSLKTTIKLRPTASITSSSTVPKIKKSKSSSSSKRLRSVGAVTRSSTKVEDSLDEVSANFMKPSIPVPDLLPLKQLKPRGYIECPLDINYSDSSVARRADESIASTPIDPLLLPDGSSESTDQKNELDMSIVTIEETKTTKDCLDNYINNENDTSESNKRLSDHGDDTSSCKRLKLEECLTREHYADVKITSDNDLVNQANEQQGFSEQDPEYEEEIVNSDKGPNSLYEYDDQNVSSASASEANHKSSHFSYEDIKLVQSNISNDILLQEPLCNQTGNITEEGPEIDDPKIGNEIVVTTENNDEIIHSGDEQYKSEYHNDCVSCQSPVKVDIAHEDVEVKQEETCSSNRNVILLNERRNDGDKLSTKSQQVVQNYYDEHFKDAESLIMETGGITMITSRKFINFY